MKFGGKELKPFIILMEHGGGVRDVERPLPTITTAKGGAMGVVKPEPFLVAMEQVNRLGPKAKSTKEPLWTISTKGAIGLAKPFLSSYHGIEKRLVPVEDPIPTIDTSNRFGVAQPFLVPNFGERDDQSPRTHSLEDPLPSVTSHGAGSLVKPELIPVKDFIGHFPSARSS